MNRADLLYACLRDGQPWTRRDIFEHTGQFFLVNNAAVELRERGLDVQWSRAGRLHLYRIVSGSLRERETDSPRHEASRTVGDPQADVAVGSSRSLSDPLIPSPLVPQSSSAEGLMDGSAVAPRPTSGDSSCVAPPPRDLPGGAAQLAFEVAA